VRCSLLSGEEGVKFVVVVVVEVAPSQANKCRERRIQIYDEDIIRIHSLEAFPRIQREISP
jgi:hypothetical protein